MRHRRLLTQSGPHPPKADDLWLATLREHCALAAIRYLKARHNIRRPIQSLTKTDLEYLSEAITAEWIKRTSERLISDGQSSPERNLLLGL